MLLLLDKFLLVLVTFFGILQFYINKKAFDSKNFSIFKELLELGDIIRIEGTPNNNEINNNLN